jgi:hypothetical protein
VALACKCHKISPGDTDSIEYPDPGTCSDEPEEINVSIHIEYVVFFQGTNGNQTTSRKQKLPNSTPKAEHVNSDSSIIIIWNVEHRNLESFKTKVIETIKEEDDASFAAHIGGQDKKNNIQWCTTIPHGQGFTAGNKKRLESNKVFGCFLDVALMASDGRKVLCKLVQKDPKVLAVVSFVSFQFFSYAF